MPAARSAAAAALNPLADLPLNSEKNGRLPTQYETRVYLLCKAIPRGRVTTYGAMAAALGSSARAVGQAMRRNPYAPAVPCHRVIASSLQLGGFSGSWGSEYASVKRKKALLESEGVAFSDDKVTSPEAVLGPADLAKLLQALPAA